MAKLEKGIFEEEWVRLTTPDHDHLWDPGTGMCVHPICVERREREEQQDTVAVLS